MASDKKKVETPADLVAAGDTALAETKIKVNSYSKHIPTRAAKGSLGWVHSPANLKLLRMAELELMQVAIQRGMKVRQPSDILYVRAAMVEGESVVHIYPTHGKDKNRIEIKRSNSGSWVNLITLVADEGLILEPGYREKFVITSVGEEGTFGPAITLDMANSLDKKLIKKRSTKSDDAAQDSAPSPAPTNEAE